MPLSLSFSFPLPSSYLHWHDSALALLRIIYLMALCFVRRHKQNGLMARKQRWSILAQMEEWFLIQESYFNMHTPTYTHKALSELSMHHPVVHMNCRWHQMNYKRKRQRRSSTADTALMSHSTLHPYYCTFFFFTFLLQFRPHPLYTHRRSLWAYPHISEEFSQRARDERTNRATLSFAVNNPQWITSPSRFISHRDWMRAMVRFVTASYPASKNQNGVLF